jgi:integrase
MTMALLIECPSCRNRNSLKNISCNCGKTLRKASGKVYWIEYYVGGKRKRERIGQSKQSAENRLREVQTAKAEGRYIRQNKNAEVNLIELLDWYLDLAEVRQKRTYHDIRLCINNFINRIGNIPVSQLTPELIEKFRKLRLTEISKTKKRPVKPSTINRDIANLRAMLNKAVDFSKLEFNPLGRIKQLEENNVREKVLNPGEFNLLLQHCPEHLKGPVLIAFYLPMRQAEILKLTWDKIDFKSGFIRLSGKQTKNKTGRVIPMHPRILKYLRQIPRPIHGGYVFEKRWFDRKGYNEAVEKADLGDFNFHDLRHCAINNLRLAGNDHFLIKQASGHKTDVAFQRYNLVTEDEMKGMKWYTEKGGETGTMDTYMDTTGNL